MRLRDTQLCVDVIIWKVNVLYIFNENDRRHKIARKDPSKIDIMYVLLFDKQGIVIIVPVLSLCLPPFRVGDILFFPGVYLSVFHKSCPLYNLNTAFTS